MKNKDTKFFVMTATLLLTCVFAWSFYFRVYSQQDTVSIHNFPKTIGEWSSEEMTITDEEYAILETRNAFARRYFTANEREVTLFIVYSQNNRKVSHPPEVCYTGGGVSVLGHTKFVVPQADQMGVNKESSKNFPLITNRLLLEQGFAKEISFYWFKVGDRFTPNYWQQQFLIALKSLLGQPSSSAMIRVSAHVLKSDTAKAEQEAVDFMQLISPMLFAYLP